MPVVIVFEYRDDDIADPQAMGNVLSTLRELVQPKPAGIHCAIRESADQVLAVFPHETGDDGA